MKLTMTERLLWISATLACGVLLPAAVIYWVASRSFFTPPAETFVIVADYYSREFDSLAWAAIWHIPPFVLLAVVCFVVSQHATRLWLSVVAFIGTLLITVPMVPRSIHLIKTTYRRNNWGEGAEYGHFALCVISCLCLCIGLWAMTAIHRSISPIRSNDELH